MSAPPVDRLARLQAALDYAIDVIESYQMDLRNSPDAIREHGLADLAWGKTLAEIGFCQGRIYTGAIERIRAIAAGESEGP